MKRRFDFLTLLTSVLFAAVSVVVSGISLNWNVDSVAADILNIAVFFAFSFTMGYVGMRLGQWLNRKRYKVVRHRSVVVGILLSILLGAVAGAVGQVIYSIDYIPHYRTVETDIVLDGIHMVLLMDGSSSMTEEKKVACNEAATRLIDNLGEDDSVQFIAFAKLVAPRNVSQFLPMTENNKVFLKDFVRSVDLAGGTDFNIPLRMALDTLQANQDEHHRSIILMLTDGEAELADDVVRTFSDAGNEIYLYTIRITGSNDSINSATRSLIDLADQDFPITPRQDGSVNVDVVLNAFQAALAARGTAAEEYMLLGLGTALFIQQNASLYWWRITVRLVTFIFLFVMAAIVYYGKQSWRRLLVHLLTGAATGVVYCVEPQAGMALYCILGLGSFATLMEVQQNV